MPRGLLAANLAVNAIYYLVTVGFLPWLALALESWIGIERHPTWWLQAAGIAVGVPAVALQLWCMVLLHRQGEGTPSPIRPTRLLVTSGPYRIVRNPLNIGEVGLFLGLAAWFGSMALLVYAGLAWAAFHVFVVKQEEERNLAAFGAQYDLYRSQVNRWVPGL